MGCIPFFKRVEMVVEGGLEKKYYLWKIFGSDGLARRGRQDQGAVGKLRLSGNAGGPEIG